jgi:hypothetical protein
LSQHVSRYTPPQHDVYDRLLVIVIFILIWAVALGAVWSGIFAPTIRAVSHGGTAAIVRPSLLWLGMGVLLLALRTVLWIRYRERPHAAGFERGRSEIFVTSTPTALSKRRGCWRSPADFAIRGLARSRAKSSCSTEILAGYRKCFRFASRFHSIS